MGTEIIKLPTKAELEMKFGGIREKLAAYKKETKEIVLDSSQSLDVLLLKLNTINEFKKDTDEKRLEFTKPYRELVETANGIVKFVLDDTDLFIIEQKQRATDYQLVLKKQEEEKQKKLKEEADAKELSLKDNKAEENMLKVRLLEHAEKALLQITEANDYPQLDKAFTENFRVFPWDEYSAIPEQVEKVRKMIKESCSLLKPSVSVEILSENQLDKYKADLETIGKLVHGIRKKRNELSANVETVLKTVTAVAEIKADIKESQVKAKGNLRMTWTFEVTDETKIPREYMELNEKLVKNFIAKNYQGTKREEEDTTSIPGIRMYKKATTTL